MGITLSHLSALGVLRMLRAEGAGIREMDSTPLVRPSTWVGRRWTMREFDSPEWHWPRPTPDVPLHVLVPRRSGRVRMAHVVEHSVWHELPPESIVWLDGQASMVCPELLFLQMAETLSLPALVMLGYELCGNFSRDATNPFGGRAQLEIPAATSVARLLEYMDSSPNARGVARAKDALQHVCDYALSPMEAILGTMYSLPPNESGYGMGPITLNERVRIGDEDAGTRARSRYPDLSFAFAPMGLNYDGEDHLDLNGLVAAALAAATAEGEALAAAKLALAQKMDAVRAKVVDDNRRNCQLAAQGRVVFPVTKEDVYGLGSLDSLTRRILSCARAVFGADVSAYERTLNDSDRARDRYVLLSLLLSGGSKGGKDALL